VQMIVSRHGPAGPHHTVPEDGGLVASGARLGFATHWWLHALLRLAAEVGLSARTREAGALSKRLAGSVCFEASTITPSPPGPAGVRLPLASSFQPTAGGESAIVQVWLFLIVFRLNSNALSAGRPRPSSSRINRGIVWRSVPSVSTCGTTRNPAALSERLPRLTRRAPFCRDGRDLSEPSW
jgi:hypothetical protein